MDAKKAEESGTGHASPDSEEGESDLFRLTETQGWKRCAGKKLGWLGRVVRAC